MSEKPGAKSSGAAAHAGAPKQPQKDNRPRGRPGQIQVSKPIVSASGKEVRGIVRLAGKDLRGSLPLRRAIVSVKGIGINLGEVISVIACVQLGVTEESMVGELSEQQVEKLEYILKNPGQYGIPSWMLNRQKNLATGSDVHMIGTDLSYVVKQDIDHEKDSNTWKGYRHAYGQKVRGQHTRSTGRTGMTVGVLRKAVLAGAAAAAQAAGAQAAGAKGAAPAAAGAKAPAGAAPKAGAAPAAGAKAPAGAAPKAGAAPAAKPAAKPEAKK